MILYSGVINMACCKKGARPEKRAPWRDIRSSLHFPSCCSKASDRSKVVLPSRVSAFKVWWLHTLKSTCVCGVTFLWQNIQHTAGKTLILVKVIEQTAKKAIEQNHMRHFWDHVFSCHHQLENYYSSLSVFNYYQKMNVYLTNWTAF